MKKTLLILFSCVLLASCSSRWFEMQALEDVSVTFENEGDDRAYSKAVICAKKLVQRPVFNKLFVYNSEYTRSFSSFFILDKDLQMNFYATLKFKAQKGKTTIELGEFYQFNRDTGNTRYAYDFYGNQYDYYKPKVDEFFKSFSNCVR